MFLRIFFSRCSSFLAGSASSQAPLLSNLISSGETGFDAVSDHLRTHQQSKYQIYFVRTALEAGVSPAGALGRGAAVPRDGDGRRRLLSEDSLVQLWLPGGRESPKLLLNYHSISYGPGPNATFLT